MGFRRLVQRRQQLRTASPVTGAGTFEVGNDHRGFCVTANLERFVHGLQHRLEFAAQVRGVHRAERRQFFGQLHHFVSGSREGAGVGKTGGQAQSTRLQTRAQL
ncbi:hypothetical protein D3C81_1516640 [compost metagenome]